MVGGRKGGEEGRRKRMEGKKGGGMGKRGR